MMFYHAHTKQACNQTYMHTQCFKYISIVIQLLPNEEKQKKKIVQLILQ